MINVTLTYSKANYMFCAKVNGLSLESKGRTFQDFLDLKESVREMAGLESIKFLCHDGVLLPTAGLEKAHKFLLLDILDDLVTNHNCDKFEEIKFKNKIFARTTYVMAESTADYHHIEECLNILRFESGTVNVKECLNLLKLRSECDSEFNYKTIEPYMPAYREVLALLKLQS